MVRIESRLAKMCNLRRVYLKEARRKSQIGTYLEILDCNVLLSPNRIMD